MSLAWLFGAGSNPNANLQYTVEDEGPAKDGEGKPRRSRFMKGKPLIDTMDPAVTTMWDNFMRGYKSAGGDAPFLGKRSVVGGVAGPYVWITYNEGLERVKKFGSFLVKRGYAVKSYVGLYSVNRSEWILGEQGCFAYNYCTVPLYDTLGKDAILHIMNQTKMEIVVASKDKIAQLIELKAQMPNLKVVVSMDEVDADLKAKANEAGIELLSFSEAEAEGAQSIVDLRTPAAEDLATICYTSGTTGVPKGAMLSHKNILSIAMSYQQAVQNGAGVSIGKDDIHISYLPLAHVFERAMMGLIVGAGARIGFYQGDTLKLLEDIAELRPTFFPSVPRLFNRIYDKVWANVRAAGGLKESLFRLAFNTKKANLAATVKHPIWDKIVFAAVRARLGGRVRFMITGSAPLSPEVMEFLRVAFSCEVLEGYGQTETSAAATITEVGDYSLGHVGIPFPCCEVKLVDVPEMGYTSKDQPYPRGEVCFRGHNCFKGYLDEPEKTKEALDKDGWVHSGDIGMWDGNGRLKIIDRKKNIFKLAQGEYIAPDKIESVYVNHELVAQSFVYGDSLQATLVGIVFPNEENLKKWAKKNGLEDKTFAEMCKLEKVKRHILAELQKHGKSHDLKGFENVKNIYLDHVLMSVENDLLTPTFKSKRHEIKQKYKKIIEQLYAELNSGESSANA